MIDPRALAALARIVPADSAPGVADAPYADALRDRAATSHRTLWERSILAGLDTLDAEAGGSFVGLSPADQDAALARLEGSPFLEALIRVGQETFYATPDSPSWAMVRYSRTPTRPNAEPIVHTNLRVTPFSGIEDAYDVVVIGAGAGGGTAAALLAEAGARVLVVERGDMLAFGEIGRDHLANHRYASAGHNTGPDENGNPRVYVTPDGVDHVIDKPWRPAWNNNAMTVGGGTRVYLGMAWRFLPEDFRLASIYGVPDGSSLADWPITYDELAPFYAQAERELGVSGDAAAHKVQGARGPYPMPPLPTTREAEVLARGAASLGISTGPVPLLINSVPYNGRAACASCGECVGFACSTDAKSGSWNAMLPRALAAGATLVTGARVTQVTTDGGVVDGVVVVDWASGARLHVCARHVVISAGAIETARLLLDSGLGNDHVGRHLQAHHYVSAFGLFDEDVQEPGGPGPTISTCDWNHNPDAGVIGGGYVSNEGLKLPVIHWSWALPPGTPRWGVGTKDAMRLQRRTSHLYGAIQEIPTPDCRVTLAPGVTDRHGAAVARIGGAYHPETVKVSAHQTARSAEWLEASGATRVWTGPPPGAFGAGQHQAGTCRMGDDPGTSATDRWGRVHGHDNLWVMDGSLHVSNGGFNPVLTIYALALRNAAHLAAL